MTASITLADSTRVKTSTSTSFAHAYDKKDVIIILSSVLSRESSLISYRDILIYTCNFIELTLLGPTATKVALMNLNQYIDPRFQFLLKYFSPNTCMPIFSQNKMFQVNSFLRRTVCVLCPKRTEESFGL